MAQTKKLIGLSDADLKVLEEFIADGGFDSSSEGVRRAIQLARCLQIQEMKGNTEVLCRKPGRKTGEVVCLPGLVK